jgi:hypothetical protein
MYILLPFIYFYLFLFPNFCLNYQPLPTPTLAEERVVRAMKYHGIGFATCNIKGGKDHWTFERDGKTCRLFTAAFKRKELKRKESIHVGQ